MNFRNAFMAATIFARAAAIGATAVHDISKEHQEILARPIELAQVFKCVQPINDGPFDQRSATLLQVQDRKSSEKYYEVQFDKTAPPPSGHAAWSETRKLLGESKTPDVGTGLKAAEGYCLRNEMS